MSRHPRFALVALVSLVALAALLLGGCMQSDGTSPVSLTKPVGAPATHHLSIRNPSDLATALRVQNENTQRFLAMPDVIGTGTGAGADGQPLLVVYARRAGVTGIPESVTGIPVEIRVIGDVKPYAKPGSGGTLQCGTSTGNDNECSAGTIGCVVIKGGNPYFLSNNHVFARENAAKIGERIDAPGRYDGKPICAQTPICGTLADFQTISFTSNNTIDCAIAKPDPSRAFTCAEAGGYTPSTTVVSAFVGQPIKKTGRTSGLTTGTVQAINVTITVGYSAGNAVFVNQIQMPGNFIRSGDSGSLMVTNDAASNPVGLCFAGGSGASFANPIGPVLQKFSATVCGQ